MNSERLKEILSTLGRYEEFMFRNREKFEERFPESKAYACLSFTEDDLVLSANYYDPPVIYIPIKEVIEWIDSLEEDDG